MVDLFRGRKWDLVGTRKVWFALSLAVILPGLYFWWAKGLNYGIDFTGGGLVTYQLSQPIASGQETAVLSQARAAITKAGVKGVIQIAGTAARKDQVLVRTQVAKEPGRSEDAVLTEQRARMQAALSEAFPGIQEAAGEMVSPVVSAELIQNAVKAVLFGCIFILLWIRLRYLDFRWAGSALSALVHDVLVLIGVFAIAQREINSPFVAAALTVVGYSVHDTIVIFDRIRENVRLRKGATFAETANISLLETMARSVNTVLTVEFVLVAVYLFGGVSLRDFTFALIIGITAGAYSSIFNASQVLVVLKNREERVIAGRRAAAGRPVREPVARRAARPAPAAPRTETPAPEVTPAKAPAEARTRDEEAEAAVAARRRTPRSARKKLRAGRKRKKRF